MSGRPVQVSKEEGDRICADVLRLVKAVLEQTQGRPPEPVLDRSFRDPDLDRLVPMRGPRGLAKARPEHADMREAS